MAGRRRDLMEQELRARREAEAHFLACEGKGEEEKLDLILICFYSFHHP